MEDIVESWITGSTPFETLSEAVKGAKGRQVGVFGVGLLRQTRTQRHNNDYIIIHPTNFV